MAKTKTSILINFFLPARDFILRLKQAGLQKVATTSQRNLSESANAPCVCLKRRTKVCPKVLLLLLGVRLYIIRGK
jgi:hypothetical protein